MLPAWQSAPRPARGDPQLAARLSAGATGSFRSFLDRHVGGVPDGLWEHVLAGPQKQALALTVIGAGLGMAAAVRERQRYHKLRPLANLVGLRKSSMKGSMSTSASDRKAVIVGAGPAGLSTALMLAQRGWSVTILERGGDPAAYDPGRGFMYLIDGRGQNCLSSLGLHLLDELKASSVSMSKADIGILTQKGLTMRTLPIKNEARESYWLPRHVLVKILLQEVMQKDNIKLLLDTSIKEMKQENPSKEQVHFVVTGDSKAGRFSEDGCLLVGADGFRSAVREQMEAWDGASGRFECKQYDSQSAGLRYKVLTLPPAVSVATKEGKKDFVSECMYAIRGAASGGRKLRLGLLPVQETVGNRTANVITMPDDPFWKINDVPGLLEYANKQWPHFPIGEMVPAEELERFAKDEGGYFPAPQHAQAAGLALDAGGMVIIGDALHCFPPDIGQGVNSALEDVMVLRDTLEAHADAPGEAVQTFDKLRMPDVKALVEMVSVSYPWQYGQAPLRNAVWTADFLWRMVLNKVLPSIFERPSFLLVQQSELPYREVWRRSEQGAFRAKLLLALLAAVGARAVWSAVV